MRFLASDSFLESSKVSLAELIVQFVVSSSAKVRTKKRMICNFVDCGSSLVQMQGVSNQSVFLLILNLIGSPAVPHRKPEGSFSRY